MNFRITRKRMTSSHSSAELSLDCKPSIGSLVLKSHAAAAEKTQKLEEFVARLEEEKLKIEVFKRELPLCMQLLTNAVEVSRQELQLQRINQLSADKANWMASATLWNHPAELGLASSSYEIEDGSEASRTRRERSVSNNNNNGSTSSNTNKEKRKARRCWSPHLHRRFLNALHLLGGSQLATPKQITQLMKVDGLTCDEVKSHLQKYRLHTGIQAPSPVLVVGSIWVPPEYAAAAHGGGPAAAFYGAHTAAVRRVPPPLFDTNFTA